MGLFNKETPEEKLDKINNELRIKIDEYLSYEKNSTKEIWIRQRLNKYGKRKLKLDNDYCRTHKEMLKTLPFNGVGVGVIYYPDELLKIAHLSKEEYRNKVIELSTTNGISAILPKIDQSITNNAGIGALGGGLLFGTTGAVVGGALGVSNQQITEQITPGDTANFKIAEKGIVITTNSETTRIPWNDIKELKDNILILKDKNIIFYEVFNNDILEPIISHRSEFVEEDGW